jgi:hypothetical protein
MLALLFALASPVSVQPLDSDRFRLTIVYGGSDLAAATQALMQIAAAAERQCRDRGKAVSYGAIEVNDVPKTDVGARKKGRLSLSENWRCVP